MSNEGVNRMPEVGVNKVILVGRTGADTEIKYTAAGKAVANFSLAMNECFRDGTGKQRDRVQWVKCMTPQVKSFRFS
jgi:single-strand DNA-binding protein